MTTDKQQILENPQVAAQKARELLNVAELSQTHFDAKKQNFVRVFKNLDVEYRKQLCSDATKLLVEKHQSNQRLDGMVYLLTCGFASERDWDATHAFLNSILETTGDAEFFKELSIVLLEICDLELGNKTSRLPVAHTTLVLLTEFGLLLASRSGKSAIDNVGTGRVVEFITTSLLARSNVNSMAMRMSLLHYLFKNPLNAHASQQLNRVISRFGQTMLEDLMSAMFEDKKRETAAFYFLLEHMNIFISTSPALAEMCHSVLRHYMLKFPDEFPKFLAAYEDKIVTEPAKLLPLTKHYTLLLRIAAEVSQRALCDSMGAILVRHLQILKDAHQPHFIQHAEQTVELLDIEAFRRGPKSILVGDTVQMVKTLLLSERDASKIVSMKLKKARDVQVKSAKIGNEPTPLESMLLLAG